MSYFLDCLNSPVPVRNNPCQQAGSQRCTVRRTRLKQCVHEHLEVPANKEFSTHIGGVKYAITEISNLDGAE